MIPIALFSWPLVAVALFAALGRMKGVIWGVIFPALTLPEKAVYDLPGLPPYDKNMAIIVGLLLGIMATRSPAASQTKAAIADPLAKNIIYGLAGLLILSAFATMITNRAPLVYGPTTLPALGLRDLITMVSASVVFLVPFLVAQHHLSTPQAHVELLRAFVVAGLCYSLLVLFEIRMSPQLHRWTYGYFQHSWQQHIRGGNFRPIVFMPHGLWIGIFLTTSVLAAFVLLKNKVKAGESRVQFLLAGFWLLGVLLISSNMGATFLALVFVPILWVLSYRVQIWIALAVMSWFLIHPALRQTELVTFERALEVVGRISVERQESFKFRVDNERKFMERAVEKPIAGWGIWSRWRVRDPVTGADISTSDGRWISVLGERGWIGFIAYFGLLTMPTFLLRRAGRRRGLTQATVGLGLIMAAVIAYQIPNNTIGPLVLIVAGALSGFALHAERDSPVQAKTRDQDPPARKNRYTRFPKNAPEPARETRTLRAGRRRTSSGLRRTFPS